MSPSPITVDNTWEEKLAFTKATHENWMGALEEQASAHDQGVDGITERTVTIKNADGGDMEVAICAPTAPGPHPVVMEIHGSGFICFSTFHPLMYASRRPIAKAGCVVVSPQYRKVAYDDEAGRFPAPLNDCLATLDWIHENMSELDGNGTVLAQGTNAGGNIAQAMALKLNGEGQMKKLNGVFSMGPFLYGQTDTNPDFLNSCEENRDYVIPNAMLDVHHDVYDGGASDMPENLTNPLSRPYHATVEQMKGLCPHAFTLNECGQARDEGIAYIRKLKEAGVPTNARIIVGSVMVGQFIAGKYATEMYKFTARAIAGFAHHGVNREE